VGALDGPFWRSPAGAVAPGHAPSAQLAAEIQGFCKAQTAPYKYPRHVEFVAELPKTISGKIRARSHCRFRNRGTEFLS
jgi:acyl-CoA synthetase (AMP-forming)/AMP-acid ligase II